MRKSTKQKILIAELESIVQEQRGQVRHQDYEDLPEYRALTKKIKPLERKQDRIQRAFWRRKERVLHAVTEQYLAVRRLIAFQPDADTAIAKALDKFKAAKFTV